MIANDIKKLHVGKVVTDVLMKDYTTYKVGGKVICMVYPDDEGSLIKLMHYLKENKIKHKIIGNGSNVIFNDEEYNGVIVKLDNFNSLKIINNTITVGAGYMLNKLALRVSRLGFTGMEFATGIPGTVGGAVFMNAGAYKSDMGYILKSIKVLTPNLNIITMYNNELDFHYRSSYLQNNPGYICIEATIVLKKGNPEKIMELINSRKERRLESQPLEYPSAGSVFRNPEGDFAGRLIEEIGYKGKKIGDAQVSEKHANFIINSGNARGEDIKKLITDIQKKIKKKYKIDLKVEQEFVE